MRRPVRPSLTPRALGLGLVCLCLGACAAPQPRDTPRAGRPLALPEALAAQTDFGAEWWSWRGHVKGLDAPDVDLDFFLAFTRREASDESCLGFKIPGTRNHAYGALLSIVERGTGAGVQRAKVNTPDVGAAGAWPDRGLVWHDGWVAQWDGGAFFVTANADGRELHLELRPERPPVALGEAGFVPLSGAPHYAFAFTRLALSGAYFDAARSTRVSGLAVAERHIGPPTNGAAPAPFGWSRVVAQLDDGRDLVLARPAGERGSPLPYPAVLVDAQGERTPLGAATWTAEGPWTSGQTGRAYPLAWRVTAGGLSVRVTPLGTAPDSELYRKGGAPLWTGAVRVEGTLDGAALGGDGWLETTADGGLGHPGYGLGAL